MDCHAAVSSIHTTYQSCASVGYICATCSDGPYCDECWPVDHGSFCGRPCRKFYCDECPNLPQPCDVCMELFCDMYADCKVKSWDGNVCGGWPAPTDT